MRMEVQVELSILGGTDILEHANIGRGKPRVRYWIDVSQYWFPVGVYFSKWRRF